MSGGGTSLSLLIGTRTRVSCPSADWLENKVEQTSSLLASLVNEELPGLWSLALMVRGEGVGMREEECSASAVAPLEAWSDRVRETGGVETISALRGDITLNPVPGSLLAGGDMVARSRKILVSETLTP